MERNARKGFEMSSARAAHVSAASRIALWEIRDRSYAKPATTAAAPRTGVENARGYIELNRLIGNGGGKDNVRKAM